MNPQNETQKQNGTIDENSKDTLKEQKAELDKFQADQETEKDRKKRDSSTFYFTEISPIQIYIQSNIPGKKPWLLSRNNFTTKIERPKPAEKIAKYSDLPFFTNEVAYPTKDLFKLEPYQIIDFFFDRKTFEQTLNNFIFLQRGAQIPSEEGDKRRPEYNEQNVMTMLQLLFTTVYPRTNNVTNSVNEFLYKRANPMDLNRIISKPTYTYMTMNGQEHTVMKVVWLNDIFNHPRYYELADKFIDYKYWCITQSKTIQRKIDNNITKIENLIRGHDFGELVGLLKERIGSTPTTPTTPLSQIRVSFEQDVFMTNVKTFEKIVSIMNSYRLFILGGKRDINTFLNEVVQTDATFLPYIGQEVEVNLDEFAPTTTNTNRTEVQNAKNFWYYGKIVKKITDNPAEQKYMVQIFYRKRGGGKDKISIQDSITLPIRLENIREPTLPKILALKKEDIQNTTIEYLHEKGETSGIQFDSPQTQPIDGNKFYNNINNISGGPKKMIRNADIFETQTDKITLDLYNKNPQFYRYKIADESNEKLIINKVKAIISKNPTDLFLGYLDMLEETYNKVKTSMNFNSRIKTFIDGVIRYHKIILPIKTINDMYLKTYKIDIQHKDISTGETATELTPYKDFATFMVDFVAPKMESSNRNLQSFVLAYAENIAGENFISLMDMLETCYSDNKPKCKKIKNEQSKEAIIQYANTSVCYVNLNNKSLPQYEIYVHVNFVKGHMDNSNWMNIKCIYNDALLTRKFKGIVGTQQRIGDWMVEPAPFVSIDGTILEEGEVEAESEVAKAIPVSNSKPSKSAIPVAKAVPIVPPPPPIPSKRITKKKRGGQRRKKRRTWRRY